MPKLFLRIYDLVPISVCTLALILFSISQAHAQILWYNGDPNNVTSLYSADNSGSNGNAGIAYDDFNVTAAAGWQVNGVLGDFLYANSATTPTSANWEIRSGVSAGNGGTLVASGTSSVSVTSLGTYPTNTNYTSYQVAVTGLNLNLSAGTYWLGLQTISSAAGYLQSTVGTGAMGSPLGDDGDAFWTGSTLGIANDGEYFESSTSVNANAKDFSEGVTGTVAPEPSTWALTLVSLGLIALLRHRAKRFRA
jgi:hypothetical protein